LEDALRELTEQEDALGQEIENLDAKLIQLEKDLSNVWIEAGNPDCSMEHQTELLLEKNVLEGLRAETNEQREKLFVDKQKIGEKRKEITKELDSLRGNLEKRDSSGSRVGRLIAAPGKAVVSTTTRAVKGVLRKANPLDKQINRSDTADHGAESMRLAYGTARKTVHTANAAGRSVKSAASVVRNVPKAVKRTAQAVGNVFVHVVAVLISPVTWVILAIGLVLYLLMSLLIILTAVAGQDNNAQQQAYATPVALGEDIPAEIAEAKGLFETAVNAKKSEFTDKIDALIFNTADMPNNDTVYLVRNEPPAEYQTSLATDARKTQLKNAWELVVSEADSIAIAYVYLERQENEAHGSQGVLYPISYSQDVFDLIVADMVTVTETEFLNQECPDANCSVHYRETANPVYATAQQAYTDAVTRRDDWNANVAPRSNAYLSALAYYRNTPAAGQPYAWQAVENAYAAFAQVVNNWSSVYGVWGLTIDERIDSTMQTRLNSEVAAAENTRNHTPQTIQTPYYTCDHLHTLYSFGLNFYTAEQVIQVLNFTEDEKQWAALTAASIQQYLIPEGG
jgi:hypothetical protein